MRRIKNRQNRHLDLLRLDALREGPGSIEEERHLKSCPLCRGALEALVSAARELKGSVPPPVEVPPEVDEAIIDHYRRAFPGKQKVIRIFPSRSWKPWLVPALGMAAAAVLVLAVALPIMRTGKMALVEQPSPVAMLDRAIVAVEAAFGDINGDGRLDILDAFCLSRSLEERISPPAAWDLTGDGQVDHSDVERAARLAVAL